MKCPVCNKPTLVKDVRERKNEAKMRRRVCPNGHAFRSYELSEERMTELLDYETIINRMRNILKLEV
jgi:transcriptional regulator NrdR family protein